MVKSDPKNLFDDGSSDKKTLKANRGLKLSMKPDESTYKIVEVPLLMSNQLSLLHRDDFYREQVEASTFTPENDIFLKIKDKFLAFDQHGN